MNLPFNNSFSGRSVFVTGHTGFKGSWITLWLKHLGAKVTGYSLAPPTTPNNFTTSGIKDLLSTHYEADIRDETTLHAAMLEASPDIIFHLAAQSIVREGYSNPRETFDINVMGTLSVLEGVRKLKNPCVVVIVTSDKCYENREQIWGYRESDSMGDVDPYGGSKGAAEIVVKTYRNSYFHPEQYGAHRVKLASVRAGNVIGGGDWTKDALLVDVAQALSQGKPVLLRNPEATRPWQHVLQALSGYLCLAAKLTNSDDKDLCSGWNIGPLPGSELPVRRVVEHFIKEWGAGAWQDASEKNPPHEATILRLCIDKALWKLGWQPGWNTPQAIIRTVNWYKTYYKGKESMLEFSLEQIREYEEVITGRKGATNSN